MNPTLIKRPEPTWDCCPLRLLRPQNRRSACCMTNWGKLGKKVEIRAHTTSVLGFVTHVVC